MRRLLTLLIVLVISVGTQLQATGASHLGHAYLNHDISYIEHKALHAALGGATALVSGNDAASAALGAAVAESTGEAAFLAGFKPENSADIAKIAGATSGLSTVSISGTTKSVIINLT